MAVRLRRPSEDDTDATPQSFRLKLDLNQCGECKLNEYGCICDH